MMKHSATLPAIAKGGASESPVKANYSFFKDRAIRLTPSSYHCKLFCGGANCKYCRSEPWSDAEQAVDGLYSSWITDSILAMARPTTKAVQEFNIVSQFKQFGITSIVNLQHVGEHRHCGPLPDASGFSYNPEEFMKNGIFHYNFGWPDFGVSSLPKMLDMVKVLSFALQQGKSAVHCHAGLGRTGVLISCYLIWERDMTGQDAIEFVRKHRIGSVQTQGQANLVCRFADFLRPLRKVFNPLASFEQYMSDQQHVLHGVEARILKHIPKLVYVACERLLELYGVARAGSLDRRLALLTAGDDLFYERILQRNAPEASGTMQRIKQLSTADFCGHSSPAAERPRRPAGRLPPLDGGGADDDAPTSAACWRDDLKRSLMRFELAEVTAYVEAYKISLQHSARSWKELVNETNSLALVALLGAWFRGVNGAPLALSNILPTENHLGEAQTKMTASQKWTILFLCNSFGQLCVGEDDLPRDTATLLCDWLTWSRDERAENYFLSCLHAVTPYSSDSFRNTDSIE